MNKKLAKLAGLVPAGKNEDGEMEYIGTQDKWDRYEQLEKAADAGSEDNDPRDDHPSPQDVYGAAELGMK